MTPDRFESFCEQIGKKFPVIDEGREALTDPKGERIWRIFELPNRQIRLTLKTTPRFEKETVTSAKRIGATAHIERIYSDTETVHTLIIEERGEDGEFQELRPEQIADLT
ncbi:MAG TPA: hypothetical protein VJC11_02250 [Patescibacteria group bacterium]|nr:hypothetical protein [Patescibacteria group bacterium]